MAHARRTALVAASLALAACRAPRRPLEGRLPPPPDARPVVQSLIGASFLDDVDFAIQGVSDGDPSASAAVEYRTVPAVGLSGMQPLTEGAVHVGLEGMLLLSGWVDDALVDSVDDVDVDTTLWLTDLSLGPYVSTSMNRPVRAYAGAGAALLIGVLDVDSNDLEDDLDDTSFDAGAYARAGVEILLRDGSLLGLGVRAVRADLHFGDGLPDVSGDSVQVFLTYSLGSDPYFAAPAW